jgi:anti-sigma B factor antagonist
VEINVTTQGDQVQVEVLGIIDDRGAEEMKRSLEDLTLTNFKEIIIDFERVTFIGSKGIGKLLSLYRNMSERGGSVALRNVPAEIHTMFRVVNLDRVLGIVSDESC